MKQLVFIKKSHHGFVKNRSCLHIDEARTIPHTLNISYSLSQQIFVIIMNEAHIVQFLGTQHAALVV